MSPVDVQRREARLIILRFLAEEANRKMTSAALTLKMNEMFLMDRDRAWVEQELDFLAEMGAIRLVPAGTVRIAILLAHGARHLSQAITIPNVMRPTDPIVLPEAMGG